MITIIGAIIAVLGFFWYFFSESIIELVNKKLEYIKEQKRKLESLTARKLNPPKCRECKWCKPYEHKSQEDLDKCGHPGAKWKYCELERTGYNVACGEYGNLYEEKS